MYPCLYVLELCDDCYYVGITTNLNFRLAQHWTGQGSKWTKEHAPLRVRQVIYPATRAMEDEVTLKLRSEFGDKVKGGSWCR